jgi:hypothetical protein
LDKTDLVAMKKNIFAAYSSARTWGNVMGIVPLLIRMNEIHRDAGLWTFNVNSVFRYLMMIQESLKKKEALLEKEKELMEVISSIKADAIEVDLFILEEPGVLAATDKNPGCLPAKSPLPVLGAKDFLHADKRIDLNDPARTNILALIY